MRYAGRDGAVCRRGRSGPPARGPAGDAVRLREPRPDRRRVAVDGRTSLYSVDDLENLARRVRRRDAEVVPRPSLDVQIVTTVTTLDESGVRYRGHDVADLARTASYERVAELLWTGTLPDEAAWPPPDPADRALAQRRRSRRRRTVAPDHGGRRLRARHPPRG